jgi:hypothetical protein
MPMRTPVSRVSTEFGVVEGIPPQTHAAAANAFTVLKGMQTLKATTIVPTYPPAKGTMLPLSKE